jgi:hypothetical protein
VAAILVAALDREIEDLVGLDRVPVVEDYLRQRGASAALAFRHHTPEAVMINGLDPPACDGNM